MGRYYGHHPARPCQPLCPYNSLAIALTLKPPTGDTHIYSACTTTTELRLTLTLYP